jgi:hypothetical protein
MQKAVNNDSVSEVSSLQSLNLTTTDSDISSVNDSLLAREMDIFEAIATLVTHVFDNLLKNVLVTAKRGKSDTDQTETPTEKEFNLLKAEITKLNEIITTYKSIIANPDAIDLIKIQECINKITKLQNNRQKLIDSLRKFIIIAKNSPILQHSLIPNKVDTTEQVIKEYTKLFPGANIPLLKEELLTDALQTKLAKFIRAMKLLDNMKHRLTLKVMILQRVHLEEINTKSQLLSVAVNIDAALKQFVDVPALSGQLLEDPYFVLSSENALSALQDIRNEARKTVDRLTDPTAEQSPDISHDNIQLNMEDDALTQPDNTNNLNEPMETVSNNLIELLTLLKNKMNTLPQSVEEIKIIEEIIEENDPNGSNTNASSGGNTTGGKSHRRKHRTKRSTPRRRRKSRVKSMKPKKRQNRRKTKSNHKKRGTKKH